jgi:hypothetical protein
LSRQATTAKSPKRGARRSTSSAIAVCRSEANFQTDQFGDPCRVQRRARHRGWPAFADHANDHLDPHPFEEAKGVLDEKDSAVQPGSSG